MVLCLFERYLEFINGRTFGSPELYIDARNLKCGKKITIVLAGAKDFEILKRLFYDSFPFCRITECLAAKRTECSLLYHTNRVLHADLFAILRLEPDRQSYTEDLPAKLRVCRCQAEIKIVLIVLNSERYVSVLETSEL
jgi:hypothetical protein